MSRGLQINLNQLAHRANIEGLHSLADANKEMIARIDRYFRTGEWHAINFVDVKREQATIAELEEEIRQLREQVKKAKDDTLYFCLRTKASDDAFRRKNNCTIYSDNAGGGLVVQVPRRTGIRTSAEHHRQVSQQFPVHP